MKKYVLAIPGIKWYLKNNFNIKLVSKDPGSAFWAMRCYETLKGRKLCPWLPNRPDDMAVRMRAVRASSYAQRLCSEKEEFRTSLTVKFYFSLKVCNRLVTVYLCAKCQDEWKQYFQITKKYLFDLWMTSSLPKPSPLRKLLVPTMMRQALVGRRVLSVNHLIDSGDFGLSNCYQGALTTRKIRGNV